MNSALASVSDCKDGLRSSGQTAWVGTGRSSRGLTDDVTAKITAISSPASDCAWYIIDEPPAEALPGVGQVAAWLRESRPDSLAYHDINGGIPDALINDILGLVKPDVLMVDTRLAPRTPLTTSTSAA